MRLAILWEQWAGYLDACVRELCARYPVELLRSHVRPNPDAPFRLEDFVAAQQVHMFETDPVERELVPLLDGFRPDALLISSWHRPEYRRIARAHAGRAVRILAMDNQWHGTLKQWAGRLAAPWYIQPLYDNAMVPGPRQRRFAGMLGFSDAAIIEPLLSCDVAKFEGAAYGPNLNPSARRFLFVGRLVEEKGIEPLIAAYRAYRAKVSESGGAPWGLLVAGTGPLRDVLSGVDGVDYRGFVQPTNLPALFGEATCFVLPSRFEPWGVVLHEAVCAGLPVICSTACGASDQFVVAGENGFVVEFGDVGALTDAMVRITELPPTALGSFYRRSRALSQKVSPKLFADAMWRRVQDFKPADLAGR